MWKEIQTHTESCGCCYSGGGDGDGVRPDTYKYSRTKRKDQSIKNEQT